MGTTPKWYEFWGTLQPMARSICVAVPAEVSAAIGRIGQARVSIRVNDTEGVTLLMSGPNATHFIKLSAAFRRAAGIQAPDSVTVNLKLLEEDPEFELPDDLRRAIDTDPKAKARWDVLPYRLKNGHAAYIAEARHPEARARRIMRVVDALSF